MQGCVKDTDIELLQQVACDTMAALQFSLSYQCLLLLQPPQPPSYEVVEHKDGSEELYINPLQE